MFEVLRIVCALGAGSFIPISDTDYMTAAHVVAPVNGCPYDEVIHRDPAEDVAVVRMERKHGYPVLKLSCDGIAPNTYYDFIHSRGRGRAMTGERRYRLDISSSLVLLNRPLPQGASGGAVLNNRGEVVGVIVASSQQAGGTLVRDLQDTALC
jgi:S1-C subfamily serine protease